MARTRAQRRRHTVLLTMAVIATLLVLLFARDISRAGHGATSPRLSENESFAALGNVMIGQENDLDTRLAYLLDHGQSLSRQVFAARLAQLQQQLPVLQTEASRLRRPLLKHRINDTIAQLTEQRVDDYQFLLSAVAAGLSMPWSTPSNVTPGLSVAAAQASLLSTNQQWNLARRGLLLEPGHVTLLATSSAMAHLDFAATMSRLSQSPSLTLTRGIGITAVSVSPAPLPAPTGEILLPPTGLIHLGVSVSNASYATQPVTLTIVLSPVGRAGVVQRQSMSVTLRPLSSYGFVPKILRIAASEHATLTLSLAGAQSGPNMVRSRRYSVVVSPSGNG
ncbi:MAG: hypothetical protein HIU84_02865 [Acidobacteria bacterium]|nr:hypothetical protein [Acidobacteriota bacterium]